MLAQRAMHVVVYDYKVFRKSWRGALFVSVVSPTGLASGAALSAPSAPPRKDNRCNAINRFIVMPLFLLGGAFFPIAQLPRLLQGVAWTTPVTHGVALCRDLLLGTAGGPSAIAHLAVLCAYIVVGLLLAGVTYRRRLVV